VYVYYELGNFYQNHRRYVQSKSSPQLMGNSIDDTQREQCNPIYTNADVGRNTSVNGSPLIPTDTAYPCGLIAKSVFNDTYILSTVDPNDASFNANTDVISFDENQIAWKSDIEKFKNQAGDWETIQWANVTDQHFIVWMRTAGLPTFRKLYAAIHDGLQEQTYYLTVTNNYDVSGWDGSKRFVLSTSNSLGGQNYFLGVAFIVVGCLCVTLAIIFFGVFMSKKDKDAENKLRAMN
jgi:hypothetical protein